ncbi:hypothetical protein L1787_02705 [Acuticoccus sp. M5D2P5]|uniref:DUF6790 family protein n=1 Tax=Acuticoccus kalidii TaxID=2910977 RepID=UPI001F32C7AE|nr:DUF6790 family protein [Acuticoccus kalidii]MCF3932323.1 hypothetical protein [Acuticoccus kalidii]
MIKLALENFTLTLFLVGLVAGLVVFLAGRARTGHALAEAMLATFLFFSVGVSYLYNFVMHTVFGEIAARFIGWEQSPFQAEVGFASLGFAAVGVFATWSGFSARVAAVLGPALFMLGAAGGHIRQMIVADNFAPGNAGVIFYTDIGFAFVGAALLVWWWRTRPTSGVRL